MQNRSEETRFSIKRAAIEAFIQGGYEAASVADICDKARVSKGAFYHHFPSKHDLFLAIMQDWLDGIDKDLASRSQSGGDVPGQIRAMGDTMGSVFAAAKGQLPLFMEFMIQASRDAKVWDAVIAPYKEYRTRFTEAISAGQKEGAISGEIEPDTAALVLMSLAIGILLQGVVTPDAADWKAVTTAGVDILLNGMERKEK